LFAPLRFDRVLIIAPHPDDDVIGAGGLIQRTIAAGGQLRVLFLTAGERNPWPQRALLKKWRITDADRNDWATLRMREAASALARLGAPADCLHLLGYPDQRLTALARAQGDRVIAELAARIRTFDPALVVMPSSFDLHGDHRATAYLAHRAVNDPSRIATYVIHGSAPADQSLFTLTLSDDECRRKREAIEAHTTQLLLGRRRFLSYARATETFYRAEEECVRVDSAGREAIDKMRHALHAISQSVLARFTR